MCGCLLAPQGGITLTTRAIRSHNYTLSNSCKLVRAPRLLCRCWPPHENHMVQRLQALCPAHRSHTEVQTGPTRTFTNDLLSATLAEAATQLSFAAFLERCIFVHASPPPHLPIPTVSLDVARQTFSHTAASRDVSTQLSFMESLASPSSLDALCPVCAAPTKPASDNHEDTTAPCVLPQPTASLEWYAHSCTTHGTPVKKAPVKFGQSKPDGLGHIGTTDSDLMHHQYRLSVLQWIHARLSFSGSRPGLQEPHRHHCGGLTVPCG